MKSTFGNKLKISIWGGSHEPCIGADITGLPAGFPIDMKKLRDFMALRAPGNSPFATKRKEPDTPVPTSGFETVDENTIVTTDKTLSFIIENKDTRSRDYSLFKDMPRPGHADYTSRIRYGDEVEMAGGGPFSGRMTAPLCIAGGIALQLLETFGITIASRITSVAGIENDSLSEGAEVNTNITMAIMDAQRRGDTVGGIVECTATGVPAGIGGAMYDGLEGCLSEIFFGIPAVKGVEFGAGFGASALHGSENNDVFYLAGKEIKTETNNAGGILGGISNGMPIVARLAFKPAPSVSLPQKTLNLRSGNQEWLRVPGRHDPCIVIRAVPVVSAAMAIGILDSILVTKDSTPDFSRMFGLIGNPLTHSFSKEIHEALGEYSYKLLSITSEEVAELFDSRDFSGLNVTIPYKQEVMRFCDKITPQATEIGAVNTIYRDDSDAVIGHNTDYEGFLYAADRAGISFEGRNVLILGSGGTSRTVRKAVSDRNAASVYIATRSIPQERPIPGIKFITYDSLNSIADMVDVIVNTTPVGMYPDTEASLLDLRSFTECKGVFDVIYNPFRTKLISDAEKLGIPCTNGLPMLVAQATAAAGYFLGIPGAFTGKNEEILEKLRQKMGNLVIIGMPGCGKTTIGRAIADLTGLKFTDLDEEIAAGHESGSIEKIFELEGEEGFRARESRVAAEFGKEHGLVIATGGGIVLNDENMDKLKQNGTVIWIQRPPEELATDGRPLSKGIDALREMEKKRIPLYEKYADITFDSTSVLKLLKLI